jgi:predicted transcriptional regulator
MNNLIDIREKFFRISNQIFDQDLNINEIGVYCVLCRYMSNDKKMCFPSISTISNMLKISTRTVIRSIHNLVKKEIIIKQKGYNHNSNKYYLLNLKPDLSEIIEMKSDTESLVTESHMKSDTESLSKVTQSHPKKTYIKKTKEKDLTKYIYTIFNYWNSNNIIKHNKLTDKIKRKVKSSLKDYSVEEITNAIKNYSYVIKSDEYFFNYKWPLVDFLKRGIEKFMDNADPLNNFKINKNKLKYKSQAQSQEDVAKKIIQEAMENDRIKNQRDDNSIIPIEANNLH